MNQELRESIEDAFEGSPDALFLVTPDLFSMAANRAARTLFGVPEQTDSCAAEVLGRALGGDAHWPEVADALARTLAGRAQRVVIPQRSSGHGRWSVRVEPVHSRDDRVRALMVRVHEGPSSGDVEGALAESMRKLRFSEAEMRSVLESAPDLIISYSRNIEVLYFNEEARRAYRELLGVELHTGLRTYDLFPQEQRAYWDTVNARVLSGQRFTEEFHATTFTGEPAIYQICYQPAWDGDSVIGFTTYGRNVAPQRRQEEALRQALKRESLGVLAGGVAHDFNNLLAVMLGNLEMMRRGGSSSESTSAFLANLEEAVLRGADLTRQMLAYAGRGTQDVRPQSLDEIVRGIAKLMAVTISKKISLRLSPSSQELPPILADRGQITQAVMNLVTNAAEALGDTPGEIRVSTAAVEVRGDEPGATLPGYEPAPGPHVVLEVSDTGPGMTPEVLERIFDPFFTTKAHGRGLGLSSLLGSLRGHRAGLRVETAVGKGSTFRLYFPVAEHPLPKPQGQPAEAPPPARSGVILLADDEPGVLKTTAALLGSFGFEVLCARDGAEAVEVFRAQSDRITLLVLDGNMPRLGGVEALTQIRAARPHLAGLICSGYGAPHAPLPSSRAPTRFLQKPYSAQELSQALQELLHGSAAAAVESPA